MWLQLRDIFGWKSTFSSFISIGAKCFGDHFHTKFPVEGDLVGQKIVGKISKSYCQFVHMMVHKKKIENNSKMTPDLAVYSRS